MVNSADNTVILVRTQPIREVIGAVERTFLKTRPELSTLWLHGFFLNSEPPMEKKLIKKEREENALR
jgi:hypothetical protein